jgi:hypothetical protein
MFHWLHENVKYVVGFLNCVLLLFTVWNLECLSDPADFVFLIDASASMQANIDAVRIGLPAFVDQIVQKKIDAVYSVVIFGVGPEIVLDASPSGDETRDILKQVIAGAGNAFVRDPKTLIHFDVSLFVAACNDFPPLNEFFRLVVCAVLRR